MINIRWTKLVGMSDLIRQACTFNSNIGVLYVKKVGNGYRYILVGEKVGNSRIAFYCDYDKAPNYAIYSANGRESFSFVDSIEKNAGYQTYKIQMLHIKNDSFRIPKLDKYTVSTVELTNYEEIVKGIASSAANSDAIGTIFVFPYNGTKHAGAFGFLTDDDSLTFTHAELPNPDGDFAFFKYDYNSGAVTRTNGVEDSTSLYTRIVNMAEPFGFLEGRAKQKNGTNK
ncbi:MAG: hypothetical protein ACP5MZ_02960 [Candidatus Micrarchaeia archaeon]